MIDRLTTLCLLREMMAYPDKDLFDLLESGELDQALGTAEAAASAETFGGSVAWAGRPTSLEEWQALYLSTFEVGIPAPKSPLQETFYVDSSSASEVIRENYLFYRHFDYPLADDPAPHDSLPKQLGFVAHLEALLTDPKTDPARSRSVALAREDYLERHLRPWLPKLLKRAGTKEVETFYLRTLTALERLLRAEPSGELAA